MPDQAASTMAAAEISHSPTVKRRQRQRRSDARTRLRLAHDRVCLDAHHASAAPMQSPKHWGVKGHADMVSPDMLAALPAAALVKLVPQLCQLLKELSTALQACAVHSDAQHAQEKAAEATAADAASAAAEALQSASDKEAQEAKDQSPRAPLRYRCDSAARGACCC